MPPRHFEAIIFSAKAATAAVVALLCSDFFNLPEAVWAAMSAVLVTQPSLHSSWKASLTRMIANLAGAFGGAALSVAIGHPILAMAVGVMLTGLVCYILKTDDAMRPAFAAVVIVTITSNAGKWSGSFERVTAVIVGCLCALVIGFLFNRLSDALNSLRKGNGKKSGPSE
jgi:uncharacterized membrane protein YgaE (UPF0421/DUF939 family)